MKRFLALVAAVAVCAAAAFAEEAKIEFATKSHDFGNIDAKKGTVSCEYEFTNTGDAPLIIKTVSNGGCGCTKPTYTKHPVKPGEKGKVTITFDPRGRRGELNRTVRVSTNASNGTQKLRFYGVVIP